MVSGAVRNPHAEPLTVSLVWRLTGADGATLGFVTARLPRLVSGEERAFVSTVYPKPCASVPGVRA
jgi:hypothetical protein